MSAGFRAGQANDGYLQINGTDILSITSGVLGIKNTGAQSEMRLYCESSNAHYASLKSPPHSDFNGNVTFTLPGTAGSSGQVLQTDGSGNLSWVIPSKMSEGNTETEVVDTGTDGHFKVTTEGTEKFRITSDGYARLTTANARLEWTASSGSNPFIRSIGSGQQELEFNTGGSERLRIDSNGGSQFTGGDSPSGRNTRISRYGSLLVATTGDILSNARCSIDSGNGNIATVGEINVGGYNGGSTTTDGVLLGAVGGVYSQLAASAAGTGVLWQGMHGSTFTSRITAAGGATLRGNLVNGSATDYVGTYLGTSTGTDLYGVRSNAENWRIKGDGSATFASGAFDIGSTGKIGVGGAPAANWQSAASSSVIQVGSSVLFDFSSAQFDVGHNYYYDGANYKFTNTGYAARLTFSKSDGSIRFWGLGTGSADANATVSEKMRITSDGNVSIGGKSNPSWHSSVDALTLGYAGVLYEDSYTSGNDNYLILGNNTYYAGSGGNTYIRSDEASRLMMQAGTFYFQSASAGTAGNAITFVDKFRINSGGDINISDGNLVIGTAGHGISFYNYDSGGGVTSNTLDDYEEGSWTPTVVGGSYSVARAYYIKVGRKVTIFLNVGLSNTNSSGFTVTLPFQGITSGYTGSSQGVECHGSCMLYNAAMVSSTYNVAVYCWNNHASLYASRTGMAWRQLLGNEVGSSIQFTAHYVSVS